MPHMQKNTKILLPQKSTYKSLVFSDGLAIPFGANRNTFFPCQISARNDCEAVNKWLIEKQDNPNTYRSYLREAERFVLWSIHVQKKPISGLAGEDIRDYLTWLMNPVLPEDWPKSKTKIIKRKLGNSSHRQAFVILSGLFGYLTDNGYLSGNPFKAISKTGAARSQKEQILASRERYIPVPLWEWLKDYIEQSKPSPNKYCAKMAYERIRFVIHFLYWTALRRSELATATMNNFRYEDDLWTLKVKGKGRSTLESVVVLEPAMKILADYRIARGLPPVPSPTEQDVPLVAALNGKDSISDTQIYRIVDTFMEHASLEVEKVNPYWKETLKATSCHWLRHTHASHNAEAGVSLQVTANQLRHRSVDTTHQVYTHIERKKQRKELQKLAQLNSGE